MSTLTITATQRTERGRKTEALREEGRVPGVLYGFEIEPQNLSVDRNELIKLYKEAGESTVLTLTVDGKEFNVLIQDIQRDPLTDFLTHVDFRRVDLNQKVDSTIALTLVGTAPAEKELGGTVIHSLEEVEVSALPTALVREIEVDISGLKTFEDAVHVSDLTIPEGIELKTDLSLTVATVQEPRKAEEIEALDAPVVDNVAEAEAAKAEEEAADDSEGSEA